MSRPRTRAEPAETQAAAWHARLGDARVSTATIEEFFAWRQDPANADAYRRVELIWGQTGRLAGDPAIDEALTAAMTRKTGSARSRPSWMPWAGAAVVAVAATMTFAGWAWWDGRSIFSTAVGEQRVVQLADGSSVRLDTDSRIRVRFDGERRLLDLQSGQALFTVAHDADRPFVVRAGRATITAIGTVFDVERDAAGASVTLVSGIVEVASGPGAPAARLAAGHQARVTAAGAVTRAVDAQSETSWTDGRIVFRDTPLSEAVAEVNRYLTDKVELDAGRLAAVPVNGVFKTGDRDAFVSTAAEVFGLETTPGPGGSIRLSEPGK